MLLFVKTWIAGKKLQHGNMGQKSIVVHHAGKKYESSLTYSFYNFVFKLYKLHAESVVQFIGKFFGNCQLNNILHTWRRSEKKTGHEHLINYKDLDNAILMLIFSIFWNKAPGVHGKST